MIKLQVIFFYAGVIVKIQYNETREKDIEDNLLFLVIDKLLGN